MILRNAASRAQFWPDKMSKVTLAAAERLYAGLNCFEPGQEHKAHTHADQDKLYLVLSGSGEATVGDQASEVGPGDLILAKAGVLHSLRNTSPERLTVLVVFAPPPARA